MISCVDENGPSTSSSLNKTCQTVFVKDWWNGISITVASNTRGRYDLRVSKYTKIPLLKEIVSKLIEVPEGQILLLHNDRYLSQGNLRENRIHDGCTLTFFVLADTGPATEEMKQEEGSSIHKKENAQNKINNFQELKKTSGKSASLCKKLRGRIKMLLQYFKPNFPP